MTEISSFVGDFVMTGALLVIVLFMLRWQKDWMRDLTAARERDSKMTQKHLEALNAITSNLHQVTTDLGNLAGELRQTLNDIRRAA